MIYKNKLYSSNRIYRSESFNSDEERLEHLFKLYEEMVMKEKENKK